MGSWKEEVREQHDELIAEVRGVRADLRRREPPPVEELIGQAELHRFPGLALSVRLCRDHENGRTLLRDLRPVPREHAGRQIRSGPFGLEVACPCGGEVRVTNTLKPCAGCDRWYVGDESGVWSVRLPEQEEVPDAA